MATGNGAIGSFTLFASNKKKPVAYNVQVDADKFAKICKKVKDVVKEQGIKNLNKINNVQDIEKKEKSVSGFTNFDLCWGGYGSYFYSDLVIKQECFNDFVNFSVKSKEIMALYDEAKSLLNIEPTDFNDKDFYKYIEQSQHAYKIWRGPDDSLPGHYLRQTKIAFNMHLKNELPLADDVEAFAASCREQKAIMDAKAVPTPVEG